MPWAVLQGRQLLSGAGDGQPEVEHELVIVPQEQLEIAALLALSPVVAVLRLLVLEVELLLLLPKVERDLALTKLLKDYRFNWH